MNEKNAVPNITETGKTSDSNAVKVSSRRKFLGQVGAALTGGAVLGRAALASAQSDNTAFGDDISGPGHGHVGDREKNGAHYGCSERSRRASRKSSLRNAFRRSR